ncbi:MazG-like family protein [Cytobacillus gottheilii]|uniref:MazG-like family protein n=1 Tax=Cytobacillus gottheilii TaxID=859144 RepID=A0ABX8FG05_9BACI|nr:MazG-like family protein [Cytobacillus gottheilii]QVY62966.1 MazG-like family protein [Cytobacillus gottheilii]
MNVTTQIKQWAVDRNLHTANPDKQMLKLFEELGELAEGMAKARPDQIKDSIGDVYVVLTILSLQLGIDIDECIAMAYDEIKDRKGRMIDGVFVKEADLKEGDE